MPAARLTGAAGREFAAIEDSRSTRPRGLRPLDDPYAVHAGKSTFLPNCYGSDWKSRLREHAFALSPRVGTAYLAARSLVSQRGAFASAPARARN
jgi:hypothetical protein